MTVFNARRHRFPINDLHYRSLAPMGAQRGRVFPAGQAGSFAHRGAFLAYPFCDLAPHVAQQLAEGLTEAFLDDMAGTIR